MVLLSSFIEENPAVGVINGIWVGGLAAFGGYTLFGPVLDLGLIFPTIYALIVGVLGFIFAYFGSVLDWSQGRVEEDRDVFYAENLETRDLSTKPTERE